MKNPSVFVIVLFSVLFFIACDKKLPEDAVYDPRFEETDSIVSLAETILQKVDHIFIQENYLVDLYIKTSDKDKLTYVENFENLPSTITAAYNVIRYKNGNLMYVVEFPYSKSGEWENIYEHVFDEKGDVLKFIRKSSFFHHDSINPTVILYEKSEYYYDHSHKLLKKTYHMKYGNLDTPPKGVKIEYPYRFDYDIFKTRKKWLKEHGLDK